MSSKDSSDGADGPDHPNDFFTKVAIGTTSAPPNALLAVGPTSAFQVDDKGTVIAKTLEIASIALTGLAPSSAVMTDATGALATGTLPVSDGGTGATTLSGVLKGNGQAPVSGMTGAANQSARWIDPATLGTGALSDNGVAVGIGTSAIPAGALLSVGASNAFRVDGAGGVTATSLALPGLGPNQAVQTDGSGKVVTGTLGVPQGGTGATSLSGVLKGNGTAGVSAMTGNAGSSARWSDGQTIGAGALADDGSTVGIGCPAPGASAKLAVSGNAIVSGVISGTNWIGGAAASVQGYGTGGNAGVFAFKYDRANFGSTPSAIQIWCSSDGVYKTFIVDHPCEPARFLVHATLEGPEGAVYYRGTASLARGRAEVVLPAYFERFTRREGRTVLLTNLDGFDPIAVRTVGGEKITNGVFIVESSNPESTQAFDWEVKAVRADGPALEPEPHRDEVEVAGFGPYTYQARRSPHRPKR